MVMQIIVIQGRQSVEVTKVLEKLYGPSDESEGWKNEVRITTRHSPAWAKHTGYVRSNSSPDSEDYLVDPIQQLTAEITFPEQHTIMRRKMCEPHKETNQQRPTGGPRVSTLQINTLGDKASRVSLSERKADGYEREFLRNKIREAGKLSSSSVMMSPTESLEDILYRKTKHVFDYPVRDMKGLQAGQHRTNPSVYLRMPPMIQCSSGAPSVTYSKVRRIQIHIYHISTSLDQLLISVSHFVLQRTDYTITQSRVSRKNEDSQHLQKVKANKGWVEPERNAYDSRLSTQRAGTASGSKAVRKSSDIISKEKKSAHYAELKQQVQERRQMMEKERGRNADAERQHQEKMEFGTWGKPGGGAPNPGSVRRSKFGSQPQVVDLAESLFLCLFL
ncbi:uncharacterized protein LOC116224348 isoform X2 [Clupea harengus]|uniref:Uncharacterized protein LOC116224348 isoform X2 n=1 Tax=Clupea harengus TaxID=7950 RepID=A0A8M1KUQ3_CLUHA|nr:uncharacterized protein LOC116224348 isoform X2 [Clupea harengus]